MSPFESTFPWSSSLLALTTSLCACWLLARAAPRLGWVDAGDGGRKTQPVPLPWVGGMGIGIALALGWTFEFLAAGRAPGAGLASGWCARLVGGADGGVFHPGERPWILAALCTAFAVGLTDDLRPGGLRPLAKLAGQALAGCVLAGPLLFAGDPTGWLLVLATPVALNALNTFDNADGAASSIALLALAPVQPIAAAAILGFLPVNVRRWDGRGLGGKAPRAILGDSGSHLLGMLILVTPPAWPLLFLPLLDLFRVCIERVRAGQAPWLGDRRHLAHRLERRGLSPLATALLLALIAAPSALATQVLPALGPLGTLLAGLGVTHVLFVIAVAASRAGGARDGLAKTGAPARLGLEG